MLNFYNHTDLTTIRKIYPTAANSELESKELHTLLSNISTVDNKTLVAYKGASLCMMAKFAKKISDKKNEFTEGAKLIELAIKSEPNNIELRLIRLSIQENIPMFIDYKRNIKQDKEYLLANYKKQVSPILEYIENFMLQSKSFTESEKQTIK